MKIERAWLRIVVSVIAGGIAVAGFVFVMNMNGGSRVTQGWFVMFLALFLIGPIVTAVLAHVLTPRETKDGHTRCGKCGYILKGLTEPRCSECGERI